VSDRCRRCGLTKSEHLPHWIRAKPDGCDDFLAVTYEGVAPLNRAVRDWGDDVKGQAFIVIATSLDARRQDIFRVTTDERAWLGRGNAESDIFDALVKQSFCRCRDEADFHLVSFPELALSQMRHIYVPCGVISEPPVELIGPIWTRYTR